MSKIKMEPNGFEIVPYYMETNNRKETKVKKENQNKKIRVTYTVHDDIDALRYGINMAMDKGGKATLKDTKIWLEGNGTGAIDDMLLYYYEVKEWEEGEG